MATRAKCGYLTGPCNEERALYLHQYFANEFPDLVPHPRNGPTGLAVVKGCYDKYKERLKEVTEHVSGCTICQSIARRYVSKFEVRLREIRMSREGFAPGARILDDETLGAVIDFDFS